MHILSSLVHPIQVAHSATEEILGVLNMGYPYSGRAEDGLITDEGKGGKIHQFTYVFVRRSALGGNKRGRVIIEWTCVVTARIPDII
jgi:hypothetical protein